MSLDDYLNALGMEAAPDHWQQMDLERRQWEEDEACQAEYKSWLDTINELRSKDGANENR